MPFHGQTEKWQIHPSPSPYGHLISYCSFLTNTNLKEQLLQRQRTETNRTFRAAQFIKAKEWKQRQCVSGRINMKREGYHIHNIIHYSIAKWEGPCTGQNIKWTKEADEFNFTSQGTIKKTWNILVISAALLSQIQSKWWVWHHNISA